MFCCRSRDRLHPGCLDGDGQKRGVQRAGDRGGPAHRPPAFRRLVHENHHPLGDRSDVQASFADNPFELFVHLAGHESQRQVPQGGQVRLGEEALQASVARSGG